MQGNSKYLHLFYLFIEVMRSIGYEKVFFQAALRLRKENRFAGKDSFFSPSAAVTAFRRSFCAKRHS
jgi:hypothetical protein